MPKIGFKPCIPVRAFQRQVPEPDWFRETTRDNSFSAKVFFASGAEQTATAAENAY
jgi:hypothetical protein